LFKRFFPALKMAELRGDEYNHPEPFSMVGKADVNVYGCIDEHE
jgi:hypothetical protein